MDGWGRQKREQELRDRLQDDRNWAAREAQRIREEENRRRDEERRRQEEARQKEAEQLRASQEEWWELTNAAPVSADEFVSDSPAPVKPETDPDSGNKAAAVIISFAFSIYVLQELGSRLANEAAVWLVGIGAGVIAYGLLRTGTGKKAVDKLATLLGWGIAIAFCGYMGWIILSSLI